jgi:hypothetical protein
LLAGQEWLLDEERTMRLQCLGELFSEGTMRATMKIPADDCSFGT